PPRGGDVPTPLSHLVSLLISPFAIVLSSLFLRLLRLERVLNRCAHLAREGSTLLSERVHVRQVRGFLAELGGQHLLRQRLASDRGGDRCGGVKRCRARRRVAGCVVRLAGHAE